MGIHPTPTYGGRTPHTDTLGQMEGHIIPGLIWLCYAGQRAMRGAAIWEGIVFLDENPEFARARALQVVMIALELHGAWRCFKHLPSLGETAAAAKSSSRNSTPTKRGGGGSGGSGGGRSRRGSSPTGKRLRVKAARVAPAADGSPNGSPRSSVA